MQLATDVDTNTKTPLTNWRPPGWIVGDVDEPYVPERIEDLFTMYRDGGYCSSGGRLTDKALALNDSDRTEIEAVIHNRRLLRDAWNTHEVAWQLAAALIGQPFHVDPFWNQGARSLPDLVVRLDGLGPLTDGMLTVKEARVLVESGGLAADVRAEVEHRLALLHGVPDSFPLNWRQHLVVGEAAAAANGPHSCTAKWLRCSAAYGTQEFSAAFMPDNGDGWFQSVAMTAALVVRLGRVPCYAPPGIDSNGKSPRGASALCVWIPPALRERVVELHAKSLAAKGKQRTKLTEAMNSLLPEPTRRVLFDGKSIAVPLWTRPRAGTQYAIVQRGDLLDGAESIVDFGLAGER